jgi:hypothetical protein
MGPEKKDFSRSQTDFWNAFLQRSALYTSRILHSVITGIPSRSLGTRTKRWVERSSTKWSEAKPTLPGYTTRSKGEGIPKLRLGTRKKPVRFVSFTTPNDYSERVFQLSLKLNVGCVPRTVFGGFLL